MEYMTTNTKCSEIFPTDSTPLAAFLMTEGFPLIDVIFKGKYANYLFLNDDPRIHELARNFELLNATTNAAQIIFNYQTLIKRAKRGY